MPVLKIKQDGVWKEIAGSAGAETLVVTLSDDSTTASHTAEEIYEHVIANNNVVLSVGSERIPLVRITVAAALFGYVLYTGEIFHHIIYDTGEHVFLESSYASKEELQVLSDLIGTTPVSEQIAAAVSQKTQVQIITWEEND